MAKQTKTPLSTTLHLSGRGTADCDKFQQRSWEQESGDASSRSFCSLPLEQSQEVFLGQLLPTCACLKLTHYALDLKLSVYTWNLTCFSSSPSPCWGKNDFSCDLNKDRFCFQSFPFSACKMFLERICWLKLFWALKKGKLLLWFMPRSFWFLMQTKICCSSSFCLSQKT